MFSARFCKTFVVLNELVSTIDTGNLSSKNLMIEARRSAHVLNDLPVNTTASPKSVSSMVDFNARIVASSSVLLAHAENQATTRLRGGLPCREATTVVKHCGASAGAVRSSTILIERDDKFPSREEFLISQAQLDIVSVGRRNVAT